MDCINKKWGLKDLGILKWCLGINVNVDEWKNEVYLICKMYIENFNKWFDNYLKSKYSVGILEDVIVNKLL